jgi:hypothetical protein
MAMDRPTGIEPQFQTEYRRHRVIGSEPNPCQQLFEQQLGHPEKDARDAERDKVFDQYVREYQAKYPEAMKLNRRAVRTLAARATTLAIIIGKGDPADHASYDRALEGFESLQRRVAGLERGIALPEEPNYQRGKSEYFNRVYGGHPVPRNEPSLREFVNVRLGEPYRTVFEVNEKTIRVANRGWHLCPNYCPGGCNHCCPVPAGLPCPGCLHCNYEGQGLPIYESSADLAPASLERMCANLNHSCLADQGKHGFPIAIDDLWSLSLYADARERCHRPKVVHVSAWAYREIRKLAPHWLGVPIDPRKINPHNIGRHVANLSEMERGRIYHEQMIGRGFRHVPEELKVDYSAVEAKLLQHHIGETLISKRAAQQGAENLKKLNDRIPCPDCAHTATPGKYVGLTVAEDCRRCGGKTTIDGDEKPEQSSTETKTNPPEKVVMFPPAKADWRELVR